MLDEFATKVLRWRHAAGLTQPQAARLLGLKSRWTVLRWEHGMTEPRGKRREKADKVIDEWWSRQAEGVGARRG